MEDVNTAGKVLCVDDVFCVRGIYVFHPLVIGPRNRVSHQFVHAVQLMIFLAERQRSSFSRIFGYGFISILFTHFLINIGMTIGMLPVIGIPLPFFSYGGSSLWAFTMFLFIFLRLDAHRLEMLG